jgi:hypothetical protein
MCNRIIFWGHNSLLNKWWNIVELLENLMLYICVKGFKSLFTYENIWLWMLVLRMCFHVVFSFHFTLVKKMILVMIKKKLSIYICHLICIYNNYGYKFWSLDVQRCNEHICIGNQLSKWILDPYTWHNKTFHDLWQDLY